MNLKKLQEMQQALDSAILAKKTKMSAEELFTKTLVALSVELAEVANCSEHFKHWKINKGKIDDKRFHADWSYGGEQIIGYYDSKTEMSSQVTKELAYHLTLVEEAADCLHFILSLANQSNETLEIDADVMLKDQVFSKEQSYLDLTWVIGNIWETAIFNLNLIDFALSYFDKLGITAVELEQAYYAKNEVNYQRLKDGY